MSDPTCYWCKKPVPERTILHVGDIPGVAAIYGHRACFFTSSYNQSPLGPIFMPYDDPIEPEHDPSELPSPQRLAPR